MLKRIPYIISFIVLSFSSFGFSQVFQAGSSGVRAVTYNLEWCRPSTNGMAIGGDNCIKGYLNSDTIDPNGNGFVTSTAFKSVTVNSTNGTPLQNSQGGAGASSQYFFNTYKLRAEGQYTFTVRFYDKTQTVGDAYQSGGVVRCQLAGDTNAGNCFQFQILYKVDKTHPNIPYVTLSDNSPYIYVGRSTQNTSSVYEQDSNTNNGNSGNEGVIRGTPSNIQDDLHTVVTNLSRDNIKTIYYSNMANGQSVTLSMSIRDFFDGDNQNYVSGLSGVALLDSNHNPTTLWGFNYESLGGQNVKQTTWSKTLTINDTSVDEKLYYIRVRDVVGNFTETPIYIVKDTTSPITDLSQFLNLLTFTQGGQTVFHTTSKTTIDGASYLYSRFFSATNSEGFTFSINDTQEPSGNTNRNNSGPVTYRLDIEKSDVCNSYEQHPLSPIDYSENGQTVLSGGPWNTTHNFSSVESKCSFNSKNTYRYYKAHIVSLDDHGTINNDKVCDRVGNCFDVGPMAFRVTANKIDFDNSTISVSSGAANNGKIVADGVGSYFFRLSIKDKYNNKVVPVKSDEDNTDIKDVNLKIDFDNKLFADQINKTGYNSTYTLALADSVDTDIKASPNRNFLNSNNDSNTANDSFSLSESPTGQGTVGVGPDGIYTFNIYSYVPTSKPYPWIGNGMDLDMKNINFKVTNSSVGLTKGASYIGEGNDDKFNTSQKEFNLSMGNLDYSDTVNRYLTVNADYGSLLNPTTPGSISVNNTKMRLNFASPFVVGYNEFRTLNEGTKNNYKVNIWKFNDSLTQDNFQFYENFLTNQPLDFEVGSGSTILSGRDDTVIGKNINLLLSDRVLNLVSSLPVFKTDFGKFVKPYLIPAIATFINTNEMRVGAVTKVVYEIGGNRIILPADGKGIDASSLSGAGFSNPAFGDSLAYYNPSYTNGGNPLSELDLNIYDNSELSTIAQSIMILGSVQSSGRVGNTADIIGGSANPNHQDIGGDIKKWVVNANVQKNISNIMRGRDWHEGDLTISGTPSIDLSSVSEKFEYNGETIVPVDGDITFGTNSYGRIDIDKKVTFIVKNGIIKIDENIRKSDKDNILSLVSVVDNGITNGQDYSNSFSHGFIYLKTSVTNLESYIFINGSVLSYDGNNKIYKGDNIEDTDKNIFNQLYIKGGIISTNTIGGSRLPDSSTEKCPWFQSPCNTTVAQGFDLVYLRRYMLVDSAQYGGPAGKKVPYLPASMAANITDYNTKKPYMGGKRYCQVSAASVNCNMDDSAELDNIHDTYIDYPLYIQFDPAIQSNGSVLFLKN